MSHVTLIRHGQANSGANDEANYDKLSVLGHKQASWLGQHLRNTNQNHTRLYTGTLQRQIDTAKAMKTGICIRIGQQPPNGFIFSCLYISIIA